MRDSFARTVVGGIRWVNKIADRMMSTEAKNKIHQKHRSTTDQTWSENVTWHVCSGWEVLLHASCEIRSLTNSRLSGTTWRRDSSINIISILKISDERAVLSHIFKMSLLGSLN